MKTISPTLKALHDQMATKRARASALLGRGADITSDEYQEAVGLDAEIDALTKQIELFAKLDGVNADAAGLGGAQSGTGGIQSVTPRMGFDPTAPKDGTATLGIFGHDGDDAVAKTFARMLEASEDSILTAKAFQAIAKPEYAAAYRKLILKRGKAEALTPSETQALYEGDDGAGGFLVPLEVIMRVIQRKANPNRLAGRFSQHTTSRDKIAMPTVNYEPNNDDADIYTSPMRLTFTGERPATSTTARMTEPEFGSVEVPIYTAMGTMTITNDLSEDTAFDLWGLIADKIIEAEEMMYEYYGLTGSGLKCPEGILRAPGTTGQPATVQINDPIDAVGIVNLEYSLPEQYDENAVWVMNKRGTEKRIAMLQDGEGRFMFATGSQDDKLASRRASQLRGAPIVRTPFMPNPGLNNYPLMYGQLDAYHLVRRLALSMQVLREVYAEINQIGLVARVRWGGAVLEPWKLKIGKQEDITP